MQALSQLSYGPLQSEDTTNSAILTETIRRVKHQPRAMYSQHGSEYINDKAAQLLKKLLIKQTKSRARRTNDNALTVRKYLGYSHIPREHVHR